MIINVIAYRADYEDTCRGCRMGGSSSDIQYYNCEELQDAVQFVANIKFEDKHSGRNYGSHDITVIIDGIVVINDQDGYWFPDSVSESEEEMQRYWDLESQFTVLVNARVEQLQIKKDALVERNRLLMEEAVAAKAAADAEKYRLHIESEYRKLKGEAL